ncbi:MAG TPA: hypothetical protein V6C97_09665 [Oculatellaceae cyanobacterium]
MTKVTLADLRSGARPIISDREFADLKGCSVATNQKDRCQKRSIPFVKDPRTGRIYHRAEEVLKFFDSLLECKSTLDYDTTQLQDNLEKARNALTQ